MGIKGIFLNAVLSMEYSYSYRLINMWKDVPGCIGVTGHFKWYAQDTDGHFPTTVSGVSIAVWQKL